jgi:hypothetical protein
MRKWRGTLLPSLDRGKPLQLGGLELVELVVMGIFALLGGVTAYVVVYNHNPIAGMLVFSAGVALLFFVGTAEAAPGPTGAPAAFIELAGPQGVLAALVGGGVGWYLADKQRSRSLNP